MKKLFILILPVVFIFTLLTSCRTHERCTAYGKTNKIELEKPQIDKAI